MAGPTSAPEQILEAMLEEDGCVEMQVDAGKWFFSARDPVSNCFSEERVVEVVGCETTDEEVDLEEVCYDG